MLTKAVFSLSGARPLSSLGEEKKKNGKSTSQDHLCAALDVVVGAGGGPQLSDTLA